MNIVTLQESLAKQMELLEAGKIDPKRVNAACNIASKFIATVRLKLDYARHVGSEPSVPELQKQVKGLDDFGAVRVQSKRAR